jgi:hypothetical protein
MRTITEDIIDELLKRGFNEPWFEFQIQSRNDKIMLRFRTFGYVFIRELELYDNDLEKLKDMIKSKIKPVFEKRRQLDIDIGIKSRNTYTEQEIYDQDTTYLFYGCERVIEFGSN